MKCKPGENYGTTSLSNHPSGKSSDCSSNNNNDINNNAIRNKINHNISNNKISNNDNTSNNNISGNYSIIIQVIIAIKQTITKMIISVISKIIITATII